MEWRVFSLLVWWMDAWKGGIYIENRMERNDESVLHTQHRETAELFEDQDQDQQALNHVLAVLVQY